MKNYKFMLLSFISLVFAGIHDSAMISAEEVVYSGSSMHIVVPDNPLAEGSLKVATHMAASYADWTQENREESFELIQRILQVWKNKGIENYLVFGKEAANFGWEVVPHDTNEWKVWRQLKVLFNISFGGPSLSLDAQKQIADDFRREMDLALDVAVSSIETMDQAKGDDPFCKDEVIASQLVFESPYINVLYNYAPLSVGEGELHFLLVPKRHCEKLSELSLEEFLEAGEIERRIVKYYKDKGLNSVYLFNKSGAEAGQTVPHWHEHIVITASKTDEFFGQLSVLKKMIFGSSPLPKDELQKRVEALRLELLKIFTQAETA